MPQKPLSPEMVELLALTTRGKINPATLGFDLKSNMRGHEQRYGNNADSVPLSSQSEPWPLFDEEPPAWFGGSQMPSPFVAWTTPEQYLRDKLLAMMKAKK